MLAFLIFFLLFLLRFPVIFNIMAKKTDDKIYSLNDHDHDCLKKERMKKVDDIDGVVNFK